MSWNAKLVVVALAALMAVPTAYTFQQQPVVASHTTYAQMDGLDPCIAAIAGIVRLRVMWFNDQVLFERAAEDGSSHVYAVEHGAPDPRPEMMTPTGEAFEFTDPNGVAWHVGEYTYVATPVGNVDGGSYGLQPGDNPPVSIDRPPGATTNDPGMWHAWVVQTGPTIEDFAASGRPYNFVTLVDTCKFQAAGAPMGHGQSGGNWSSTWGNDTTQGQHLPSDSDHQHDRFSVDLYVGKQPRLANADPEYLGVPE